MLEDAARVLVHVVDDFPDAARGDGADDAVAATEAGEGRELVTEPGDAGERLAFLLEQHDHAVGGDDHLSRLLQRELRDAFEVEECRQFLRKGVNEVDLAVQMQDLGAERLSLRFARGEVPEQRRDRLRRVRSRDPAEAGLAVGHRKALRRVPGGQLAVEQSSVRVHDRHRRTERGRDGRQQGARRRGPANQLPELRACHD